MTLGDFGEPPFQIVIPLKMINPHINSESIRATAFADLTNNLADQIANNQAKQNATSVPADQKSGDVSRGGGDDNDSSQDKESLQFREDEDISDLTSNDIATVQAEMVAGTINGMSSPAASMLDEAPTTIEDRFSSVVGDSFHFMDRPKVPMHHDDKKGYFVALRQAWFQWDLTKLAEVKATLRIERGMNVSEIEAMLYYDVDYFCVRVPCVVLPPSKLYWRVCAVYEMYGTMLDAKTKAPLFNKAACLTIN
jgi:hypothetical protein